MGGAERVRSAGYAGRDGGRVAVQVLQELVWIDGAGVGGQRLRRLDDLEVHVRHVAEPGARIIWIATAAGDQGSRRHMGCVFHIELPNVAVEKRDRFSAV